VRRIERTARKKSPDDDAKYVGLLDRLKAIDVPFSGLTTMAAFEAVTASATVGRAWPNLGR
jgi:hypothetical protein